MRWGWTSRTHFILLLLKPLVECSLLIGNLSAKRGSWQRRPVLSWRIRLTRAATRFRRWPITPVLQRSENSSPYYPSRTLVMSDQKLEIAAS